MGSVLTGVARRRDEARVRSNARAVVAAVALGLAMGLLAWLPPTTGRAQSSEEHGYAIGVQFRLGGRYDNVRLCVASGTGVKGGPAGDIAFFSEFGLTDRWSLTATLPVFRPIMFAAAFQMLQFEPLVTLNRRYTRDGADFIIGPSLGVSLNYGPGYQSATSGPEREPSFWAVGPTFGGYAGFDFDRQGELFNFQLGISPYVTPLFSPEPGRNGVVVGGMLDAFLRFSP